MTTSLGKRMSSSQDMPPPARSERPRRRVYEQHGVLLEEEDPSGKLIVFNNKNPHDLRRPPGLFSTFPVNSEFYKDDNEHPISFGGKRRSRRRGKRCRRCKRKTRKYKYRR